MRPVISIISPCATPSAPLMVVRSSVGALGHDAFETFPLGLGEEFGAVPFAVSAEGNQLVARQNCLQPHLALAQRLLAQVRRLLKHEIEGAVQELCFMAQRVVKQLEMRDAVLTDRDKLTVDHGAALHAL